jgi:hypothetical protein
LRYSFWVAAAVLLALHVVSIPLTIWEHDEVQFALGVDRYEPLRHHPAPPGAPLFIGAAKLVRPLFPDAFHALRALNVAATIAGLAALLAAFESLTRNRTTATLSACLFYASPSMLVHGMAAFSDTGAVALLALALWLGAKAQDEPRFAWGFALACAAAVGWRPQFAMAVVPLLFATLVFVRGWRARGLALVSFTVGCLAWLVPLVAATGGIAGFVQWLFGQAAYYAAHDASLSRNGVSTSLLFFRFIAHPWGPKLLAFPVLLAAAIGAALSLRMKRLLPIAVMGAVYLAFALATMDPADAVRYALPSLVVVALFAAIAVTRLRHAAWLALAAYTIGAYVYTSPLLRARAHTPSPPVAAAAALRALVPRHSIVLYDLPLRPHAEYLLPDFPQMRMDEGLRRFGDRVDVPLFIYADGAVRQHVYQWPDSDAYRKLTRGFYRAVSFVDVPPQRRYVALEGIFAPERSRDGESWRWIAAHAALRLPDVRASHVRITLRLPPEYPFEDNRVSVGGGTVVLRRGASQSILVPLARGPNTIRIVPERSFVPNDLPGRNNRDRRTLSVMLTSVEQLP